MINYFRQFLTESYKLSLIQHALKNRILNSGSMIYTSLGYLS